MDAVVRHWWLPTYSAPLTRPLLSSLRSNRLLISASGKALVEGVNDHMVAVECSESGLRVGLIPTWVARLSLLQFCASRSLGLGATAVDRTGLFPGLREDSQTHRCLSFHLGTQPPEPRRPTAARRLGRFFKNPSSM